MTTPLRKQCQRCGKLREVNHSRDTPVCGDCFHAARHGTHPWMEHGACRNPAYDPEWWWPTTNDVHETATSLALDICSACSVRDLCLDYAFQHNETEGIWGGKMPGPRRQIAAEQRRMAAKKRRRAV